MIWVALLQRTKQTPITNSNGCISSKSPQYSKVLPPSPLVSTPSPAKSVCRAAASQRRCFSYVPVLPLSGCFS